MRKTPCLPPRVAPNQVLEPQQMGGSMQLRIVKTAIVLAIALTIAPTAKAQDRFQASIPTTAAASLASAKAQYAQTKKATQAVEAMSALTKAQPQYYAAHYNLGLVLADEGRYDDAIASLSRARDIREQEGIKDATIYNSLGWAYMLKGDAKNAEASFLKGKQNEALLSNESKARLYNNMGWLYMSTGKYSASREVLTLADQKYDSDKARSNLQMLERVETTYKAAAAR